MIDKILYRQDWATRTNPA